MKFLFLIVFIIALNIFINSILVRLEARKVFERYNNKKIRLRNIK
ncbi:MAG: hypothetical protein E6344_07340 [Clostridium sp.]|nr:hypothetical protein [Clostridium sp.]MDU7083490.1 hypothetical protein [Clostridium sp.]